MESVVSKIVPESELSSRHPNNTPNILAAKPTRILELISYQEGAVISRTLSNRNTGTITLFAFDEDQGLSEHTSPFDGLVQILEGSMEIIVSGKRMQAKAGEIVVLPANQSHSLNALSKSKMLLTMIRSM